MKPPKIVKAPEGCGNKFIPGNEYPVHAIVAEPNGSQGYVFYVKNGNEYIFCVEKGSSLLNGQDWIIVSREN